MWSTLSWLSPGRRGEATNAVTAFARVSSRRISLSSWLAGPFGGSRVGSAAPEASAAGRSPLPEALVSSHSHSPSPSRLTRERVFCHEADGTGPKAGIFGKVIGFGSTCMMSRSV